MQISGRDKLLKTAGNKASLRMNHNKNYAEHLNDLARQSNTQNNIELLRNMGKLSDCVVNNEKLKSNEK